jgi:sec-independent protein translocase protein TatA
MGSLSLVHWLVVLLAVVLLFGGSRLAALGKGLGDGVRAVRKGLSDSPSRNDPEGKQS